MQRLKVISVNTSEKKGTVKKEVAKILLNEAGAEGDAHSGHWNRQLSLLANESVQRFEKLAGRKVLHGEFAENITTEGIELYNCKPLDMFYNESLRLEVTQIGKACHGDSCAIYREVGSCVMPREGIFCRVIKGGELQAGDEFIFEEKVFMVYIITLSDRASAGIYPDKSGPEIRTGLEEFFKHINYPVDFHHHIISDDEKELHHLILEARKNNADLIFTTGGTGIGPRDITPETIQPMLDKEIPGVMDHIRIKYGMDKPNALISRSVAGVIDKCLVFTLPGSLKAVKEYMTEINKGLKHLIYMLHGLDMH